MSKRLTEIGSRACDSDLRRIVKEAEKEAERQINAERSEAGRIAFKRRERIKNGKTTENREKGI